MPFSLRRAYTTDRQSCAAQETKTVLWRQSPLLAAREAEDSGCSRSSWTIENGTHHGRDTALCEDRCSLRKAAWSVRGFRSRRERTGRASVRAVGLAQKWLHGGRLSGSPDAAHGICSAPVRRPPSVRTTKDKQTGHVPGQRETRRDFTWITKRAQKMPPPRCSST